MIPLRHLGALATVVLACACSSTDTGPMDPEAGSEEAALSGDGGDLDVAADDATDADPTNGDAADADSSTVAPAAPPCPAGDRAEWSGTIPGTVIAVSVCSACGESYVVAASGGADSGEVTLTNGAATITASVPAHGEVTSNKLAGAAIDGSVSVCGTADGAHGCLPVSPKNEKYCDPFRDITKLASLRIDQGVDYGGAGPIYAMGPGIIDLYKNRNDSGWPGGTFMSYKLTAGPAAGQTIYLAENIDLDPKLKSGSYVWNGTVLGTLVNGSPYCEIGWGVAGAGYTAEHACYVENCSTTLGLNFNDLLVCLKTPSGIKTSLTGCCSADSSYPSSWCPSIDSWQ